MIRAVFKEIDILKFLEILIMSSTRISAVVSINFKIFLQSLIWAKNEGLLNFPLSAFQEGKLNDMAEVLSVLKVK